MMNIIDMRTTLRRSSGSNAPGINLFGERRKGERRAMKTEVVKTDPNSHRVWLTPGERALIEDLYLLGEKS